MTANREDSLKCIFKVVQPYVAKHHPEELRYFGLLWENFANKVRNSGDDLLALGNQVGRSYLSVLGFAGANNLKLATPFAILTVAAVIQEIQAQVTLPSEHQIRNAIHSCAVQFGASHKLVGQMETGLAKSLFSMFTQLQTGVNPPIKVSNGGDAHIILINVGETIIMEGKTVKLYPQQALVLFYELVRRRRLHWLHGFLIFEPWRRLPPANPRRQFDNVVSKLNIALSNCGEFLTVRRNELEGHKNGFVELEIPLNIRIVGDINEANTLAETAFQLINKGHEEEALVSAQQSFLKDSRGTKSVVAFFRAVCHKSEKSIDKVLLPRTWQALHRIYRSTEDALAVINAFSVPGRRIILSEDEQEIEQKLKGDLQQLSDHIIIADQLYHKQRVLSPEEFEYEQILHIIDNIRKNRDNTLVQQLCTLPSVNKMLNLVKEDLGKVFENIENRGIEVIQIIQNEFILNICCKGKRAEEYDDLPRLIKNWQSNLRRLCVEAIVEQIYGISKKEQSLYREYYSVISSKKLDITRMGTDEIALALGGKWDGKRIAEARAIGEQFQYLTDIINIPNYWNVFIPKKGHGVTKVGGS